MPPSAEKKNCLVDFPFRQLRKSAEPGQLLAVPDLLLEEILRNFGIKITNFKFRYLVLEPELLDDSHDLVDAAVADRVTGRPYPQRYAFLARLGQKKLDFFFHDTAATEIYTLSLHDALPISWPTTWMQTMALGPPLWSCPVEWRKRGPHPRLTATRQRSRSSARTASSTWASWSQGSPNTRSEEHTSELQSQSNLVCRLLLEKK